MVSMVGLRISMVGWMWFWMVVSRMARTLWWAVRLVRLVWLVRWWRHFSNCKYNSELKFYFDFHPIYSGKNWVELSVFPSKRFINQCCDKVSLVLVVSYRNYPMTKQREK